MSDDDDRTASLMTPARLAQLKVRPQAPASAVAWLDQLAADAGSGHIRRLMDLRRQLLALLEEAQAPDAAHAADKLAAALGEVDFSLLQPRGWLARATGKGKEAGAVFAAQCDACAGAATALATEVRAVQRRHEAQAGPLARTAAECELEVRAIERIMDQGARWLQDMRGQLKAREAAGGDAGVQAKILEDTRRCELLVGRLKQLRAAASAAAQAVEHCKTLAQRAAAVAASLQQAESGWKDTGRRLDALAGEAGGNPAAQRVEACRQALPPLLQALRQASADAQAVQAQEQALAAQLAALQEPLQAAA